MWLIFVVVVFLTAAFNFVLVFVFFNVGFGFHVAVYFFVVCRNRDTLAFNLCFILFFNLLRILGFHLLSFCVPCILLHLV